MILSAPFSDIRYDELLRFIERPRAVVDSIYNMAVDVSEHSSSRDKSCVSKLAMQDFGSLITIIGDGRNRSSPHVLQGETKLKQ